MAEIFREPLKLLVDVQLGILINIRHVVSTWWRIGSLLETTNMNGSKLK